MADLRRADTPESVRDRTADPPHGSTEVSAAPTGAERQAKVDDRGAGARPRHAREPAEERAGMGGRPSMGAMLASAPSAIALLGGIWLLISRLVFSYPAAGSAADGVLNGVIVGIAVALSALALMTYPNSNPVLGFVIAVLGAWMIASPWVFGYHSWGSQSRPTYSDVITGAAIVASGLATWLAGTARHLTGMRRRPGTAM